MDVLNSIADSNTAISSDFLQIFYEIRSETVAI